MTLKMLRLLVACLCIFPTALFALGLGDIRLKSALNEPLDAEIELVSATPDELASLRASLASQETFARYGLERPRFLSSLDFRVGTATDGRQVLFVRSRESVTEPFLTFLIEVNWSRGRLLREYTLLLDPPVYMPGGEEGASEPVSAPQTSSQEISRPAPIERPAEPDAPTAAAPAPSTSRPSAPISADAGSYTVRDNDTLWQIASGLRPGSRADINRMMIALFQTNPEAFRGNINRLQSGAILRIPSDTEFDSLAAADAAAEVRRQTAEWREQRGLVADTEAAEAARLRLVTPTEGGEGAGATPTPPVEQAAPATQPGVPPATAPGDSGRLPVTDPDLARLQQQQPGQAPDAAAPTTPEGTPAEPPPATAETGAQPPAEAAPDAAAEPTPSPAQPTAAAPTSAPEEPGLIDWLLDKWLFILGGLLLLGVIVIFSLRRREPDAGALGRLARAEEAVREMNLDREEPAPPTSRTASMRAPKLKDEAFLVEESGEHQAPRAARTAELPRVEPPSRPEPVRPSKADQTLSSETAINLDQGDPLAEADFHMAYGLYDQAADLVRIAMEREPQRRDLKLKLLEIFFVWGNKDAFLQTARQLYEARSRSPAGEWDKIAIMGRQIAPEDSMFAQGAGGGAAASDVDLNLEGGENRVDLDLLGPPEGESGGGIDLDLGGVLRGEDDTAITGESPALKEEEGLDFVLDDTGRGAPDSATTREMAARTMETPTVETPRYGSDSPTVESTALRERGSSTIKEKIDSALFRKESVSPEQTAELALDDLGLDLDSLRGADRASLDDDDGGDAPTDAATMVAGMDDKSRRLIAEAELRQREEDTAMMAGAQQSPTGTWILDEKTLASTMALPGAADMASDTARMRAMQSDSKSDTARRRRLDAESTAELAKLSADDMDLDLDRLEQALKGDTVKQQRKGSSDEERFSSDVFTSSDHTATDLDVDVGDVRRDRDRAPTATSRIPADEMALPELEPVTMSEVGTKLDLARAYMDMGDPEGARSILDEVLSEGSATQKLEAQRLIDSLPG